MEDFYTNISQDESFNHSDSPYDYYNYFDYWNYYNYFGFPNYFDYYNYFNYFNYFDYFNYFGFPNYFDYYNYFNYFGFPNYLDYHYHNDHSDISVDYPAINVMTYLIIGIILPLMLVAIIALYSTIRNDHVAPIYVINLLISDVIQLCCMIADVTPFKGSSFDIYGCAVAASIGFMVCIALERYLVIACPLWYQVRGTIKTSVVVCVLVWALGLFYFMASYFWLDDDISSKIIFVFLLFPFPLFIFSLVGTIKALSGTVSVPSDEKRRIVGVLVLVLPIYALLYLPTIISLYPDETTHNNDLVVVSGIFIRLCPLADLLLFIFMRKGIIDKLLASVCCCITEEDSNNTSTSLP